MYLVTLHHWDTLNKPLVAAYRQMLTVSHCDTGEKVKTWRFWKEKTTIWTYVLHVGKINVHTCVCVSQTIKWCTIQSSSFYYWSWPDFICVWSFVLRTVDSSCSVPCSFSRLHTNIRNWNQTPRRFLRRLWKLVNRKMGSLELLLHQRETRIHFNTSWETKLTLSCTGDTWSSSVPQGEVSPVGTRLTAISAWPLPCGPFILTNSMLLYL